MRLDHLLSKEKSTLKIVRESFDCLILRGLHRPIAQLVRAHA